jgi:serine protease Do
MTIAVASITQTQSDLASDLASLVERVRSSTVQVRNQGPGGGTGIIWQSDGLIITNAHVAHSDSIEVELADGRKFSAEVVARDPRRDLAALRVQSGNLPVATIGDSAALRTGELVLAVGNPFGSVGAVSLGIIHTLHAPGPHHQQWIQADVRLAPGYSGGPLVNARGEVIGINTMIAGGLGLAVPSNAVARFLRRQQERPAVGVTIQPVPVTFDGNQALGLLVVEVASHSSAEAAGLLLGDVLLGTAAGLFHTPDELLNAVSILDAGEVLTLDLLRGGVRRTLDVILLSAPAQEGAAA